MQLICFRWSHDRGPGPDEAEPIVFVLSAEVIVTVPWTMMHRVDQLNQARDPF
jgi:hypothetical protein